MSRLKPIGGIIGLVVVAVAAGAFIVLGSGPATGTVTSKKDSNRENFTIGATNGDERSELTGNLFKLLYPISLGEPSDTLANQPTALEQWTLLRSNQPGYTKLITTIKALEPSGLSEESGYAFRAARPAEYTETRETLGNNTFTSMATNDGTEIVSFITRASYVAIISLTSSQTNLDLRQLHNDIVTSFSWR